MTQSRNRVCFFPISIILRRDSIAIVNNSGLFDKSELTGAMFMSPRETKE